MLPDHKTRIVATIGPASDVPSVLEAMIRAGLESLDTGFDKVAALLDQSSHGHAVSCNDSIETKFATKDIRDNMF